MQILVDTNLEKQEIQKRFDKVIKALRSDTKPEDIDRINKAFDLAIEAHKDMRRKTGEPYIYHPLEVSYICVTEIGLGPTSVICALLHDVVEDTDFKLEDIERLFGPLIKSIIDGLTKISGIFDGESAITIQAENLKRMTLTLADDVRVILIKLADRLHNMRTLDVMPHDKQLKIASETLFLFAPLAHRLGLHAIKTELEDLSLKYTEPQIYHTIFEKLKESSKERDKFIQQFVEPLKKKLVDQSMTFDIYGRAKSICSIWEKMKKKNVPFEEVFDLFAIRIIIDSPFEDEKINCWKVYSVVTDIYKPNTDRLRDWISIPKANGYEALHTTVMSSTGKWVEVQIRTKRMDEIAEKGYAAHWRYKEAVNYESGLDKWLNKIRELLHSGESNALDFLDDFKMNLFAEEVFIFTPKGELRTLPIGSTVLDFAYAIHSQLGNHCIGAKVNLNLVKPDHKLQSGDQVEILTSDIQKPNDLWLNFVATLRAKNDIKNAIKIDKRNLAEKGKTELKEYFKQINLEYNNQNITDIRNYFKINNSLDLYYDVAIGNIGLKELKDYRRGKEKGQLYKLFRRLTRTIVNPIDNSKLLANNIIDNLKRHSDTFLISDQTDKINYTLARCCNPLPGEEVVGFLTSDNKNIEVHRTSCEEAIQFMSTHGDKIVKSKWIDESVEFLAGIRFVGIDKPGLLNKITKIISLDMNLNIQSVSFDSSTGLFEGIIKVYINDTNLLNQMIDNFRKIEEIKQVYRITRN